MLDTPFEILQCSWPRPVKQVDGLWTSDPEWDAPPMPMRPQPQWAPIQGDWCWTIDWRDWFQGGLKFWQPRLSGEMHGFHIVFHLQINASGTLIFWDDDGCLIRRNGEIIHADRTAHPPARSTIAVQAGDRLEVAQWQHVGGWIWGAQLASSDATGQTAVDLLLPYLDAVQQRLKDPKGPALKMYFSGQTPIRTALSLYSMILNGYSPAAVLVFGEYQWSEQSRKLFDDLLPFAQIVPTRVVLERIQSLGGPRLAKMAREQWTVMKICIGLLYHPQEFCFMDDDVFILDGIDEALHAFQRYNLVFSPDADYSQAYKDLWSWLDERKTPLPTGTLNTGLYWLRNTHDPRRLAADVLRMSSERMPAWLWEQAFMAAQFVDENVFQLPTQRYFYPYFDGLPGGMLGYDYARNPCGFTSIHFGGLAEKPSDAVALILAPEILGRSLRCP